MLEGTNYLITVCHFSDWIELDKLQDTYSSTIVEKSKQHFGRLGTPEVCHTDNGPQFISRDYEAFAKSWSFKHTTSSPYHSQGNGRAEAAVKVCKTLLRKSEDIDKALLNYRNTPPVGHTYSPAQRMMSRRTRTLLPTHESLLAPQQIDINLVSREMQSKRTISKEHYDRSASGELPPLEIGSYAYAKPAPRHRGDPWIHGRVVEESGPRSYTLQNSDGRMIRRNRVQLRPAAAPTVSVTSQPPVATGNHAPQPRPVPAYKPSTPADNTAPVPSRPVDSYQPHVTLVDPAVTRVQSPVIQNTEATPVRTRSGREVKPRVIISM